MIEELSTTTTKNLWLITNLDVLASLNKVQRTKLTQSQSSQSSGELKHFSMKLEHKDDKNYMYT